MEEEEKEEMIGESGLDEKIEEEEDERRTPDELEKEDEKKDDKGELISQTSHQEKKKLILSPLSKSMLLPSPLTHTRREERTLHRREPLGCWPCLVADVREGVAMWVCQAWGSWVVVAC